jgi:hypothetical protein
MFAASNNPAEVEGSEALWIRDLTLIESSYGRLVYVSGLRNQDTGRYEHFGFNNSPSNLVASRTLKKIHEIIFREWVGFSLEKKKIDIEIYISGLADIERSELIDAWLRLTPYKNLVPASIPGPERHKHISDFEAILGLMKNVYGVASPDAGA